MDGAVVPVVAVAVDEGYPHFVLPVMTKQRYTIITQSIKILLTHQIAGANMYLESFKATVNMKTSVIAFSIARID